MSKISILVPIFNVEPYLRECLESIVNQVLRDIEIICINDGSTDRSLAIAEDFASRDERIRIINKTNSGYGHSMNQGLELATGKYVGIVESDDFADHRMFEQLYNLAEEYGADVVKSNFYEYTSNTESNKFFENLKGCPYNRIFSPTEEQSVFFTLPSIWSGLYKRSFLINNDIRFLETPGASYQDTSFAFKVWASSERVYLSNDAFLHYRTDNMGSSVNSAAKIFCVCDEQAEISRFLESHPAKKAKLHSLAFALKYASYRWNYNRLIPVFQYVFLQKMIEQYTEAKQRGDIDSKYLDIGALEEINRIVYEPDKYFKETGKDYRDDRLLTSSTLNLQIYKRVFLETIHDYKKVIIYGAGLIGKQVAQKLINDEKIGHITCFAVSNTSGNPEELFGLPVLDVRQLSERADDSIVIIATKEKDQYEIIQLLKSLGFNHIVSMDSNLLRALS